MPIATNTQRIAALEAKVDAILASIDEMLERKLDEFAAALDKAVRAGEPDKGYRPWSHVY